MFCLFTGLYFPLQWSVRMKIMLGAAKGLAYLHDEAEKPLIYRDFKTSNILLDRVTLILLHICDASFKQLAFIPS